MHRYAKAAIRGLVLGFVLCGIFTLKGERLLRRYKGVDPQVYPYVNGWLKLAKDYGFNFNNNVSVGFTTIKMQHAIGLTNYGLFFTEVDLDMDYWEKSSEISKKSLIFHELTHSYCNRGHTYGDNKEYPKEEDYGILAKDGFYPDKCPLSIMYPYLIEDFCMLRHYNDYVKEMFDYCQPE